MKLNLLKLMTLPAASALIAAAALPLRAGEVPAAEYYGEVVRLDAADSEADLQEMLDAGAKMLRRRQDLALMLFPYPSGGEEGEASAMMTRSGRRAPGNQGSRWRIPRIAPVPAMDVAIPLTGANHVAKGTRLPAPYTGAGVVAGFCDVGFDSRHINFTDPATGECRIARVVRYVESEGARYVYDSPEDIQAFHTDDEDQYHATHVAGIMAGSYPLADMPGVMTGSAVSGIAPGCEIVATVSELSEVGLLAGVEDIIEYAKSVGKPAVINMSVGNYVGPHDGSSLFCKYLDLCAEDAVICLSSGNEGQDTNHQYLPQASAQQPLKVRIAGADWVNLELTGQTDIYAADSTPFTVTLRVADSTLDYENPLVSQTEPIDLSVTPFRVLSSVPVPDDPDVIYDEGFSRWFDGRIYVLGGIDPENGRYAANIIYDCTTTEPFSDEKRWARYRIDVIATPQAPVRLDAFADGIRSWLAAAGDNPNRPGNEISVSDLATGYKTVSVGMYCSRLNVPLLDGTVYSGENDKAYSISLYSGYGYTPDGRRLPMTSAPGRPIVSSWSGAYIAAHDDSDCSHYVDAPDGTRHYWAPMSGTSMSSPYVAGVVATWLEAVPSLTWKDVQEILAATNYYPDFDEDPAPADNPRYGMGLLNAYEGIKLALKDYADATVGVLPDDASRLRAVPAGNELHVFNPDCEEVRLTCHSMQGTLLADFSAGSGAFIAIPMTELRGAAGSGPCVVTVAGRSSAPRTLKLL
ncbi:MAG: S8 family serine peptidase [Muribaculaceae bacterium]|nr:S8 family serine peptidase [Muribaculaceae bacterium]